MSCATSWFTNWNVAWPGCSTAGAIGGRESAGLSAGRQPRLCSSSALAGTTRVVAVADGTQQPKATQTEPAKVPAAPKAMPERSKACKPSPTRCRPRCRLRRKPCWKSTGFPKVSLENPTLHRGIVLAPDGHPLPGASIYAASTIELLELAKAEKVGVKDLGPVRAVTDAQGRFEFHAQDLSWVTPAGVRKRWETLLVAAEDGVVSGWIGTYGDDRTFRSHWNPYPGKKMFRIF